MMYALVLLLASADASAGCPAPAVNPANALWESLSDSEFRRLYETGKHERADPDLDVPSPFDGHSKVYYAATFDKPALLDKLLASAAADRSDDGLALIDSAGLGRLGSVRRLLDAGADAKSHTDRGYTAAMAAANWGHTEILRLLIERGADLRARASNGADALELAFFDHQRESVATIFDADLQVTDLRALGFRSPAWWAERMGDACLKQLLEKYAAAQERARRGSASKSR